MEKAIHITNLKKFKVFSRKSVSTDLLGGRILSESHSNLIRYPGSFKIREKK